MTHIVSLLSVIFSITYFSWADQPLEQSVKRISLRENVKIVANQLEDTVDFINIEGSDNIAIDKQLSTYKVQRISSSFISKDGRYVITFVKTSETQIKRVLFIKDLATPIADDVISVEDKIIKTSHGLISSSNSLINKTTAVSSGFKFSR